MSISELLLIQMNTRVHYNYAAEGLTPKRNVEDPLNWPVSHLKKKKKMTQRDAMRTPKIVIPNTQGKRIGLPPEEP